MGFWDNKLFFKESAINLIIAYDRYIKDNRGREDWTPLTIKEFLELTENEQITLKYWEEDYNEEQNNTRD